MPPVSQAPCFQQRLIAPAARTSINASAVLAQSSSEIQHQPDDSLHRFHRVSVGARSQDIVGGLLDRANANALGGKFLKLGDLCAYEINIWMSLQNVQLLVKPFLAWKPESPRSLRDGL